MGPPSLTTVHRHPRFALSLIVVLLITVLLLIAPRPGETALDPLRFLWRPSGNDIYVDKGYNPGISMWGDLSRILEYSEGVYQDIVRKRNNYIEVWGGEGSIAAFPEPYTHFYTMWDFFVPGFSCPHPVTRIGTLGDGGKWVCGYERVIHQRDCVIYSSGVAQESTFEKDILDRSSTCKIYGYDFSVENWGPQIRDVPEYQSRIFFKPWKLAATVNEAADPPEFSLQGLMAKNGHTFIDILKLDIEGSEFEVLDSIFKEYKGRPLPFGQLQLEVHAHVDGKTFSEFLHWWERLEEAGLRPFWTEPNLPHVNSYRVAPSVSEWSFINIRGNHVLVQQPERTH